MRSVVKILGEIQRQKPKVGVNGISKTVDNDVRIIDRSFGAVEMIEQVIHVACMNGIGVVKLMGGSKQ